MSKLCKFRQLYKLPDYIHLMPRTHRGVPSDRCNVLILPRHNAAGSSIMAGYSATILPAARLWLPQYCRQQHRGCHNIAALALILLLGQDYGRHNIADGKIAAAITLLPAGSWQLQSCCLSKYYVRCTLSSWSNTWRALLSGFSCYILRAKRGLSFSFAWGNAWCVSHKKANSPERGMEQHYGKCSNYFDAIMLPAAAL